jgi:poly-gamma-glutamate system protein
MGQGTAVEAYQDPRLTPVIGQQFSLITTDFDIFEAKLASANPNFAAAMVDVLKQAKVGRGDLVAVGMTGSYPGMNLAVLCACEAIGAIPVTVTAVGSTWWGANDPDLTWPDMERILNAKGVIHSHPLAGSLGGSRDEAFGMSNIGQDLLRAAIERNGLVPIHENELPASVARRMELYTEAAGGKSYAAYVAVGSGEADLGHPSNAKLIGDGYINKLPLRNYPSRGVIHTFNSQGVEIINISNPMVISQVYGLGGAEVPLADVGQGGVYASERYDMRVAGFSALVALFLIVTLVRLDAKIFRLREAGVDPDTLM